MAKILQQYAVLPLTVIAGNLQVLLVTSRGTQRWIIPKGHPEKKMKPCAVAAMEAREEAGVSGSVGKKPLGTYRATKRLPSGKVVPCEVTVFRMDVLEHHSGWKEDHERRRIWVPLARAGSFVDDGDLAAFIREFEASFTAATSAARCVREPEAHIPADR